MFFEVSNLSKLRLNIISVVKYLSVGIFTTNQTGAVFKLDFPSIKKISYIKVFVLHVVVGFVKSLRLSNLIHRSASNFTGEHYLIKLLERSVKLAVFINSLALLHFCIDVLLKLRDGQIL